MKRFFLTAMLALMTLGLYALEATVVSAKGKAELQSGNKWVKLSPGDTLKKGSVIQTGFKSELVLKIKESTVTVAPLSRVTIEQLSSTSKKDDTKLFLDTGSVNSNVKKADGKKVGFTVRSPVATASVRGTKLTVSNKFQSTSVKTHEGTVAVWKSKNEGPVIQEDAGDEQAVESESSESGAESAAAGSDSAVAAASDDSAEAVSDGDAPEGAFTVTKGQTAGFTSGGNTTSAQSNAASTAYALPSSTQTAASAEAVATSSSSAASSDTTATSTSKKGSISVTVVWDE